MGQNGYLTEPMDGSIPNCEFGEDVSEADLVGFKDDAGGRRVLFKALAAAGGTQVAAIGIAPKDKKAGLTFDAVRRNRWRIALPSPLPAALTGLQPGDPVYLSPTTGGAMTKTKPTTAGQLVQIVGWAYYTSDERRGMPASADANGVLVDIQPGTVVGA